MLVRKSEFSFERLEVYNKAVKFTNSVFDICENLPNNLQYSLADQLRRAALSIINNLAGVAIKDFQKKKRNFMSML